MSQTFRKLLENDNLLVGINELSQMCEVSPRQVTLLGIKKGLIQSVPQEENASRKYRLPPW